MKGGLSNILKQAQQMQKQLEKAQEELLHSEYIGKSGAGDLMVVVTTNGRHSAKKVELQINFEKLFNTTIDPAIAAEAKEILEDLIKAAINDASDKIEQGSRDKMSGLASGMKMPAGFDFPFGDKE